MQIVILAGGVASRLRPLTETIPKSMIMVSGKPFLEYQLNLIKDNGIENVVLCVGYRHEQIEEYFGDGSRFGVNITYSYEKEKLLGTGGALKNAEQYLEKDFFIMYGDAYLPINFKAVRKYFLNQNTTACMVVYRNESKYDKSNVIFNNNKVITYDKKKYLPEMEYIDYGLSIVSKKVLDFLPAGVFIDLADFFYDLAVQGNLSGYEVNARFYEIGSFGGIKDFKKYIAGDIV